MSLVCIFRCSLFPWTVRLFFFFFCLAPRCGLFSGQNVSFVFVNITMTWTEAQSFCRDHHTDLARARNMAENQEINNKIPAGERVWIGLYRNAWGWSDGSESWFRYWNTGEPNDSGNEGKCAAADMKNSGKWEDWSCDIKRAFVCYKGQCSGLYVFLFPTYEDSHD